MLYRTRAKLKSVVQRVLVRAFDKAVRRKPLAFAADAVGLWALHVGERGLGRRGGGAGVERYDLREGRGGCIDHEACKARNVSVTRHTSK